MCSKNYQMIRQKYSAVIDCLSFQQNNSLNILLTDNVSNFLVFQQKYFATVIEQEIKESYVDLAVVFQLHTK